MPAAPIADRAVAPAEVPRNVRLLMLDVMLCFLPVPDVAGVSVVPFFSVGPPDRMHFAFEPAFTVERTTPLNLDVERKVRHYVGRVEARMLADIPCWQHWMVEDVFGTLDGWRDKPIHERYAV